MSEALTNFRDPEVLVLRYLDDPRPDLKDMIMMECSGLVERVAKRFSGLEPVEDLIQVGYIGLLNALSKFDPKAGVRFTTYATHLVAGEIKHYLRDRAQTIRHPAWLQELRHRVNKSVGMLQANLGRMPTPREIAESCNISEASVQEIYATQEMLRVASLDAPQSPDEDGAAESETLDAGAMCRDQLSVEDRVVLETAMRQLRDLERQVLVHFHFDAMNQSEIAHQLGISCNYVSHILRQSLAKLRRILTSEDHLDRLLKKTNNLDSGDIVDRATGVYTEQYFKNRLREELHRCSAHETSVSIVRIEFEGIEKLRSFYGESSVEDLIADAADYLRSSVRRLDVVCRMGESGFAIILPSTGATALVVAQRLSHKLGAWLSSRHLPGGPIKSEITWAIYPEDGESAEDLIAASNRSSSISEAA